MRIIALLMGAIGFAMWLGGAVWLALYGLNPMVTTYKDGVMLFGCVLVYTSIRLYPWRGIRRER